MTASGGCLPARLGILDVRQGSSLQQQLYDRQPAPPHLQKFQVTPLWVARIAEYDSWQGGCKGWEPSPLDSPVQDHAAGLSGRPAWMQGSVAADRCSTP